jgi:photosystem II stability/assembly factor-like uncharacterized protein
MKKTIFLFILISFLLNLASASENKKSPYQSKSILNKTQRLIYNSEYEFERTKDPATGKLPSNIKEKEMQFSKTIPTVEQARSMNKLSGNSPLIQAQNWKPRGPWNTGGRFNCITFDINNENIILAGSASGGIWRTIDKGSSWVKVTASEAVQSAYCIVQDPRPGKNSIWYCGTGEMLSTTERQFSLDSRTFLSGNGIYKSTDNGVSWKVLSSTLGNATNILSDTFQGIWNISIDKTNTNQDVVLAACYGGIMRSTDGGSSWTSVLGDQVNKSFGTAVVQSGNGVFFAGLSRITLNNVKPTQMGIYRSVDGINWSKINPAGFPDTTRVIKFDVTKANDNVLYILTEKPQVGLYPWYFGTSRRYHGLFKYIDDPISGNGTSQDRSEFIPNTAHGVQAFSSLGGYALTLKVSPADENFVAIGGTSLYVSSTGFANGVMKHIGGYFPQGGYDIENKYCHPDIHGLAFLPSNPNTLYVANDGGIHMTSDAKANQPEWVSLNNGLMASQFYSIALDHAVSGDNLIFGGLQDNSSQYTLSENVNEPWPAVIGGDGMDALIADNKAFLIGSWYNGAMVTFRFNAQNEVIDEMYQRPDNIKDNMVDFYTRFVLDPNNQKTLYLPAKTRLFRKDDMEAASRDTSLRNPGWFELKNLGIPTTESITAISVCKATPNRVYIGTSRGIFYKIDEANSATPIITKLTYVFPKDAFTSCIDIDPKNSNNIIVSFSNYNIQSIYSTTDGGTSWNPISGNLEEKPDGKGAGPSVRWIKSVYTKDGTIIFAGTSAGLYSTFQLAGMSTDWRKEGYTTIGNLIVDKIDFRESDGKVLIATQGGGVFSTNVKYSDVEDQTDYSFYLEKCLPNPVNQSADISFTLDQPSSIELILFNSNGQKLDQIAVGDYSTGRHTINFNASKLPSGVYFYTLFNGRDRLTQSLLIER